MATMNMYATGKDIARCLVTFAKAPTRSLASFADAARRLETDRRAEREATMQAIRNRENPDVLFVWVPKSAGTSLSVELEAVGAQRLLTPSEIRRHFDNRGIVTFGHICIDSLIEAGLVSAEFLDSCWSFSVVRNPFDRAVSLYEYLRSRDELPAAIPFAMFCEMIAGGHYDDIGLFNRSALNQVNPQTRWLLSTDGGVRVDRVFRFEQIGECIDELKRRIPLPPNCQISRHNATRRDKLRTYYDSRSIAQIQEGYRTDFETFGYPWDPPWTEDS